jgi:hypothetical protein
MREGRAEGHRLGSTVAGSLPSYPPQASIWASVFVIVPNDNVVKCTPNCAVGHLRSFLQLWNQEGHYGPLCTIAVGWKGNLLPGMDLTD